MNLMMSFTLRYVRFYQGIDSRTELVTLAPGLRPERRFRITGIHLSNQVYQPYSRYGSVKPWHLMVKLMNQILSPDILV